MNEMELVMRCPTCQSEARRFGKDRHGNQRYQCLTCRKTWTDRPAKPLDEMRIPLTKALFVLKLLTEGMSVRATSRTTGVAKGTILYLLAMVGQKCEDFLAERLQRVPAKNVQCDEIWGWVRMKEKVKTKKGLNDDEIGDAYCYVAIERKSKIILAWHLGKRDAIDTLEFTTKVEESTRGRFMISTDGWKPYQQCIPIVFEGEGRKVDHAAVVKQYGKMEDDHRYSPSAVLSTEVYACCGGPNLDKACTSHVERQNLTIRMQNRRMTRLTNAFSKKWANHQASLALHFATYNFVTPHGTLTKKADGAKTTPAMAAGLTDHPWTLEELLIEASKESTQS
jgi:transposase-like protein/IS1 family transposase